MRRLLFVAALAGSFGFGSAAAHEVPVLLVTPPAIPHPLPQGVPYVVAGATLQKVHTLRYGIVNGRRVLFDGETMRIVYVLQP